ncbi:hypothetical protein [Neisseria weaveri]|uniref:Phage protein n=1 Tax=Neisseria weaveri TaxID=28091 RepID=A0A3S5F9K0_9NEIS|nr:hypothetical protein [Neisseria weaveri]EGV38445.1 hypothetical protein l11_04680 [Neisseria weaveri LMG 5135]VEJ50006.1 phage protein [Neisseria weaveri]
MKVYVAKTPLILQDEAGEDFRVEVNEVVQLTPEQYQDVAAHVIPGEISDEDLAAAGYQPDGTPLQEDPPPPPAEKQENPPAVQQEGDTKSGRGRKAKEA